MSGVTITSRNVGNLTTYELRQELIRRDKLDIPEKQINHRSMLQRLMVELVAEESVKVEINTTIAIDEANKKREEAKALREHKKLEALERSKQRQSNPEYFDKIKELNTKPDKIIETTANDAVEASVTDGTEAKMLAEEEDDDDKVQQDPFRSYVSKQRSKVYVR